MRYFTYILQSEKDNRYYIGQTSNVEKRILEHNSGNVTSTKYRKPLILIYSEEFKTRIEAIGRERYFKSFKNTKDLLNHLDSSKTKAA